MLAYASQNARPAGRVGSPKALLLIVAGHAALIAAVMAAKMEIVRIPPLDPTVLIDIPAPPPPPTPETRPDPKPQQPVIQDSSIEQPTTIVPMDATDLGFDRGQAMQDLATVIGTDVRLPQFDPPRHVPVKLGPRLATAADALKPPYPSDKLRAQEEATLKLRLTIDARGRVTSVEPIGAADPGFLAAARRHILKSWHYKPATEDGVAVATTTVISLSFRLEEA
jgi:protein TonB